jgi:hypothetical protein
VTKRENSNIGSILYCSRTVISSIIHTSTNSSVNDSYEPRVIFKTLFFSVKELCISGLYNDSPNIEWIVSAISLILL